MFIAVEGLDGTGKSTLAVRLAAHLGAELLRTPDAAFSEVRPVLDRTLAFSPRAHTLMYASMVQFASDQARWHAANGRHVVVDRYWSSTLAYDAVFRHSDLPFDALGDGLFRPDVTLFLEAPLSVRAGRIAGRGLASAEDERGLDRELDARLQAAYDWALSGRHVGNLARVDVSGATPTEVLRMALSYVDHDIVLRETLH